MDPTRLSEIINIASGRCWSSDTYNPCPGVMDGVPASNHYQGGFGTTLMLKVHMSLANKSQLNIVNAGPWFGHGCCC